MSENVIAPADEPRAIVFQTNTADLVIFEGRFPKGRILLQHGFFRTTYGQGWETSDRTTAIVATPEEFAAMVSICELAPANESAKDLLGEFIAERWPHALYKTMTV